MKIRALSLALFTWFVLSQHMPIAFAFSNSFSDLSLSSPSYTAIMYLKNNGILQGYPDGTFKPDQQVNRAEALKTILLGLEISVKDAAGTISLKDINPDSWYAPYVIAAIQRGIIQGYSDGTFRPAQTVNLVESLKIMLLAAKINLTTIPPQQNLYSDAFNNQWYSPYLAYAKNKNLIQPDGQNKIYPNKAITRAELADILYKFIIQKGSSQATSPEPPSSSLTPPATGLSLTVSGNELIDANGKPVRLLGVNRSGQEFKCIQTGTPGALGWGIFDGPTDLASAQAIASWKANTVRLPLNEDCWLGINGVNSQWGGINYQNAIKDYVAKLHQAGLYVILDLHWNAPGSIPALSQQPLPDADHADDFWKSVATTFSTDQGVIFDLYNEPFIYQSYLKDPAQDSWNCWLNGCTINQYLTGGSSYTQPYEWNSVGMQTLVNTIRATGAKNVIMIGGLDWANDLSGWLSHEPTDAQNAIIVSWHSYPGQGCSTTSCWDQIIAPLADKIPIITGETGDSVCNTASYLSTFLPWANSHNLSYLGWTWNTWNDCNNVLIKDYTGISTTNYGQIFHDFLSTASYSSLQK